MNISKNVLTACFVGGAAAFLFQQPAEAGARHITCNSMNNNYNYCRVDTDNQVQLTRQISSHGCTQGETWGYDAHGVWVDRGCRAEFSVGNSNYNDYNQSMGGVPPWAVGNFQGQNERDHSPAAISISPNGDVTATWAGQQHKGYFEHNNLRLGNLDLIVKQRGNGFETILRSDHGNRVFFQRVQ
jgi:hypothetical protein